MLEGERRWNEAESGAVDMAGPCREHGVSRPTGYAWVKRFRQANHHGVRAVEEIPTAAVESERLLAPDRGLDHPGAQGDARRGPRAARPSPRPPDETARTAEDGADCRDGGAQPTPHASLSRADSACRTATGATCSTLLGADTRHLLRAEPMRRAAVEVVGGMSRARPPARAERARQAAAGRPPRAPPPHGK